jgi:hypothetical protein
VGRFHILETLLALDRYKQTSTELLTMLDQVVYPALREDPANGSGMYPIRFRPGGFTFEIETPGGGLHLPRMITGRLPFVTSTGGTSRHLPSSA